MNAKVRLIEVDLETADLLEARAAALGMSVSEGDANPIPQQFSENFPQSIGKIRLNSSRALNAPATRRDVITGLERVPERAGEEIFKCRAPLSMRSRSGCDPSMS
jgi:hypothetical protein